MFCIGKSELHARWYRRISYCSVWRIAGDLVEVTPPKALWHLGFRQNVILYK